MDGLVRAIGDGLTGLIAGSLGAIGAALRGMVDQVVRVVPGPLLFILVAGGLTLLAWSLAKR